MANFLIVHLDSSVTFQKFNNLLKLNPRIVDKSYIL